MQTSLAGRRVRAAGPTVVLYGHGEEGGTSVSLLGTVTNDATLDLGGGALPDLVGDMVLNK